MIPAKTAARHAGTPLPTALTTVASPRAMLLRLLAA